MSDTGSIPRQVLTPRRQDMPSPACRLVQWTPWPFDNPSLIGHCSIAFQGGWVVSHVPVFRSKDGLAVGVPSIPQLDRDGHIKLKPDGKRDYAVALSFENKEARERWQRLVLSALAAGGIGGAS